MRKIFKEVFPSAIELHLAAHFSTLSEEEQNQLIERYENDKYLIITQPHGGRR